ncbi:MAG: hypothetical protein ACLP1D_03555 [Xanthobacteraceae bacterium]|jgi:hypothetical protein
MSRHHMLPPITYVPTPKPKKIEKRRRSSAAQGASAASDVDETGDIVEDAPVTASSVPQAYPTQVETAAERGPPTPGKLSSTTLTAVLVEQEKANG